MGVWAPQARVATASAPLNSLRDRSLSNDSEGSRAYCSTPSRANLGPTNRYELLDEIIAQGIVLREM